MRSKLLGGFIIVAAWGLGEMISRFTALQLPASITGLLCLSLGLFSGLLRLEWIEEAAEWFLKHLVLFLVPAVVGVLRHLDVLQANWLTISTTLVLSWGCVVLVSVYVARRFNMKTAVEDEVKNA